VPETSASGAVALTDPPVLLKASVGKGLVLINEVLWADTEANRLEGMRIASGLLTGLGVRMDLSPFGPASARVFRPLDLAPYATLGLKGDPGSGWMDHGPGALAGLPVGRRTYRGVPFYVADPAANGGRSVVALRGNARPAYPAQVAGIPVNSRARALHLLHACAWGSGEGKEAARLVVHYADGTQRAAPLRAGIEVADWYSDPRPLPMADVAWRGQIKDKAGPIGLTMMRWANPRPETPIRSVDLVSAGGDPVYVLFALTVEK
jgi:hypothetical protein